MKSLFYNDQAYIADQFTITDHHISNISLFAYYKINTYKLSLKNQAYCVSKKDITTLIHNSLLNYTRPDELLLTTGFFSSVIDN
jgi:hypothetical protein